MEVQSAIRVGGWKQRVNDCTIVGELDGDIVASARHAAAAIVELPVRKFVWVAVSKMWQGQADADGQRVSDSTMSWLLGHAREVADKHGEQLLWSMSDVVNIRSAALLRRHGWIDTTTLWIDRGIVGADTQYRHWATTV
jgi:hypothetical protein